MNRERVHPNLIRHRIKTTGSRSSRRMHQNIQAAEVFHNLFNTLTARLRIRDVHFNKVGRCPMSLSGSEKAIRHRSGFPGSHGDVRTLECQGEGCGSPNTTGTPGD